MAARHPKLMTVVFKVADRPRGSVLVDYNQNAWGRTLASIYSLRPVPLATVSTPVTWQEVEKGFRIADFRIDNIRRPAPPERRPLEAAARVSWPLRSRQAPVTLPLRFPYPPMEAETASELPKGDEWQYEPKWDGFRCIAFRDGDDIRLQSKAGKPLERYFPDVVGAPARARCAYVSSSMARSSWK